MKDKISKIIQSVVDIEEGDYSWGGQQYNLTNIDKAANEILALMEQEHKFFLKTKNDFNIYDQVWTLIHNKVQRLSIAAKREKTYIVPKSSTVFKYGLTNNISSSYDLEWKKSSEIFKTKAELIASL